ncbi:MAG TPA: acetate kinase [Bacilli bacterium]|jgi:acetate kinase|nr:acetate kinase [Bacilli bacterium]MDD3388794.1 acetate kinase [Bacilli bacterium]MDD4344584.1 acetate kinase [Bacilli bacterium]HKM11050.1 acetate kinase [Bacilli bacterium]
MSTKVMAVNAGSSSLKFKLYQMPEEIVICSGIADRIGHDDGIFKISYDSKTKKKVIPLPDHRVAVKLLLNALIDLQIVQSLSEIQAIGHRVVQGGKYFSDSVLFDLATAEKIESLIPLAPLHNHAHLIGYQAFKDALPDTPAIAVFDTAFHQTMVAQDYLFPIPYRYFEKYDIRRYGAHGTSHQYLGLEAEEFLPGVEHPRVISCHIGSGASITAIKDRKCVATSMGLTPLGGIMMGTRTGDIDPSVMMYACKMTGKDVYEMYQIFNHKSGMLGVSGISNDTRDIEEATEKGDERAIITNQLFARRVADYIGQYFVRLGGADIIVFSAGIGENSGYYRQLIIDEIKDALGITYDKEKNLPLRGEKALISLPDSRVKVAIIPTDEEIMIARDCVRILKL